MIIVAMDWLSDSFEKKRKREKEERKREKERESFCSRKPVQSWVQFLQWTNPSQQEWSNPGPSLQVVQKEIPSAGLNS